MQCFIRRNVSKYLLSGAILAVPIIAADRSYAEPVFETGLIHVSIQLGNTENASGQLPLSNDLVDGATGNVLSFGTVSRGPQLPDSLRFAGLAGALNLAIDKSNGRPRVEGIELAPREILSIGANGNGGLRGLQGQISIRLDF